MDRLQEGLQDPLSLVYGDSVVSVWVWRVCVCVCGVGGGGGGGVSVCVVRIVCER